jgi:cis-3-alkyl-4-acyloxetan-2-one decarboxylase
MNRLPSRDLPDWLSRQLPAGAERYRLGVGELAMQVMEVGGGRPVVLLHGNPTWGFLYRKVAAELAGAPLRLIMPDLIGLGFSDRPRSASEHQLENHAQWVARLFDALGLTEMLLVVHDWGGPIGLRAASLRPGLAKGLVVMNTIVGPPRPGFRPTPFQRLGNIPLLGALVFRGLSFPQVMLHKVQGDPRTIEGDVARAYRHPLRRLAGNAAPLALTRMAPTAAPDHPSREPLAKVQAFLEAFEGPSAIVWGDRDPIAGALRPRVEAALPRARVTRTQAGHFLQEEVPKEIAEAIRHVAAQLGWM